MDLLCLCYNQHNAYITLRKAGACIYNHSDLENHTLLYGGSEDTVVIEATIEEPGKVNQPEAAH